MIPASDTPDGTGGIVTRSLHPKHGRGILRALVLTQSPDRFLISATDPDSDANDVVLLDADDYILTFDDRSGV